MRGILFAAVLCLLFAGPVGAEHISGPYLLYQNVSDFNLEEGVWSSGSYYVTVTEDGYIIPGTAFSSLRGYERNGKKIYIESPSFYPRSSYSAVVTKGDHSEPFLPSWNTILLGSTITITLQAPNPGVKVSHLELIRPDGTSEHISESYVIQPSTTGQYQVKAIFDSEDFLPNIDEENLEYELFSFVVTENAESTVTAVSEFASYVLGEEISISGTSTTGAALTFSIQGNAFDETEITSLSKYFQDSEHKNWQISFSTEYLVSKSGQELNAGVYSINIKEMGELKGTVVVTLIQPYISFTSVPEKIVVGNNVPAVSGNAEAAENIQYYILGPDFFKSAVIPVQDEQFTIDLSIYTDEYTPGEYFLVVQHPMFDKQFNLSPDGTKIMLKKAGSDSAVFLYDVFDSTPKNIANSIYSTIISRDIDDNAVLSSFDVVIPTITEYSIPETIPKGSALTLSGFVRPNGEYSITVILRDSEFAAVPPETLPPESMTTKSTMTEMSGDWELVVDTAVLEGGVYDLIIKVGDLKAWESQLFFVLVPDFSSASLPLKAGWNFISIPKYLDSSCDTAGELFASLDTDGMSHLGYDAKTGWYVLKADTQLKPLDGYWVYSKEAANLPLTYSQEINVPAVKAVYKGWNAVGLSAETSLPAGFVFSNLDWVRCLSWDLEEGKWGTVIAKNVQVHNSEETPVTLGNGNWLYVETDGTYLGNTA